MNKLRILLFAVLILSIHTSCEEDGIDGNLLVTVKSEGHIISQATVYLKSGALLSPNIPLAQYDFVQRADGSGEVYFEKLSPNQYFVYAEGYDDVLKKYVHGESSITVISRTRQNEYKMTVTSVP